LLKQRAAPDSRRTLLFATRQRLLADCLSMLFTSDGTWSVQVVGVDHPDPSRSVVQPTRLSS